MKSPVKELLCAVLATVLMLMHTDAGYAATPSACDRSCLQGVLQRYLQAVVAQDPSQAGFSPGARSTENAQVIHPGEGTWKSASGFGDYRIEVVDTRAQAIGFFGVLKEGAESHVYFVRLKAPGGKVSEAETLVAREIPPSFARAAAAIAVARPGFAEAVGARERGSRKALIAAADSYYRGVERNRGDVVAFAKDCHRIENGVALVNNPDAPFEFVSPSGRKLPNFGAMGCREQFDTGIWGTDAISHRRFPLVDEKTGVVAAFTIYRSHAKGQCATVRGYGQVCSSGTSRFDLDLVELFKIHGGKIHEMESIWTVIPTDHGPGW